jgi:hypothetical protein
MLSLLITKSHNTLQFSIKPNNPVHHNDDDDIS